MRDLPETFRSALEAPNDRDAAIFFLTIEHDDWDAPVRLVSDVKNYVLDGDAYVAFPFELELLTDSEEAPGGAIAVQNVDRAIGEELQALSSPPTVALQIFSSADFDLTADPRTALGTPQVAYEFTNVFLRDVEVDAVSVRAALRSWDYVQEPYPSRRATSALLPGLYL